MSESLIPGTLVTLTDSVRRLVAPNPGLMTGPGTNTYLVGRDEIAVIDPGPDIDVHVQQIVATAAGRIRYILATHTHPDHSPAVTRLARLTGARIIGLPAPPGPHQDQTFQPDTQPADGDTLAVDGLRLQLIHTPGHASNHLCVFVGSSGWLFTGDHIINGSTVVIDPPDGNMSAYLLSLRRLRELPLTAIAGGHGAVFHQPYDAIERLIEHRLRREAKVSACVSAYPALTLSELVRFVYEEIDPGLHRLAERSLLAHLLKLEEDGVVSCAGERWVPAGSPA